MHCGHTNCFGCSWLFHMLHNCSAVNYMALMLSPPPKTVFLSTILLFVTVKKLRRIFSDVHTKFCLDLCRKMKWRTDTHLRAESVQWYLKRAFLSSVLQSTVFVVCTICYSTQRLYISFLDTINVSHNKAKLHLSLYMPSTHKGRSCLAPPILTLNNRWTCVFNITLRQLYPWKSRYSLK